MTEIDYSKVQLQDAATADNGAGMDYELNRISDTRWEIIAISYGRRGETEKLVATLPDEASAQTAWEQVMACMNGERGVLYFASSTPCWEITWFDEGDFEIHSQLTRSEGEKNQTLMTLEEEHMPHKVRMVPIEHWTENPLFATEKDEGQGEAWTTNRESVPTGVSLLLGKGRQGE